MLRVQGTIVSLSVNTSRKQLRRCLLTRVRLMSMCSLWHSKRMPGRSWIPICQTPIRATVSTSHIVNGHGFLVGKILRRDYATMFMLNYQKDPNIHC